MTAVDAVDGSHPPASRCQNAVSIDGPECRFLAKTYRQRHLCGTSAMAPGSDIPAAMSDFELISSALPPGSDIADSPGIREVMTRLGHCNDHVSAGSTSSSLPEIVTGAKTQSPIGLSVLTVPTSPSQTVVCGLNSLGMIAASSVVCGMSVPWTVPGVP